MPDLAQYCHARRADAYSIVGHCQRGIPNVVVASAEEWEEPPKGTPFGLRQSLWCDWMARRFGQPYPRAAFVWNNGSPYHVVRGHPNTGR